MDRTGKCLCGAVRFTARDPGPEVGACYRMEIDGFAGAEHAD